MTYVRPQIELITSIAEGIYAASGDIYGIEEPEAGTIEQRSGSGHGDKVEENNWGEGNVQSRFMVYLDGEISSTHLVVTVTLDQESTNTWGSFSVSGTNPIECDIWSAVTEFELTVTTAYPGVSITDVSWRAAD